MSRVTCASVGSLMSLKDVTEEMATKARTIWQTQKPALAMTRINSLLGYSGVECLGVHKRTGQTVCYLNSGDLYTPTVIFYSDDTMRVGTVASLVEHNMIWDINDENRPGWPH